MAPTGYLRHTRVVENDRTAPSGQVDPSAPDRHGAEHRTRWAVARVLLEDGSVTASHVAARVGVSPAGARRHLDALVHDDEAGSTVPPVRPGRGRGRPARRYRLTGRGRAQFGHAYDDLAVAALRQLRELGGDAAVEEFARRRVAGITAEVAGAPRRVDRAAVAQDLADAFSSAGYAASAREVGSGVQLCQHHCPVAHVAAEFPQLCEAERSAFADLLGTHVQRLATIANGDAVCTTHVPLGTDRTTARSTHEPRTVLRKELA